MRAVAWLEVTDDDEVILVHAGLIDEPELIADYGGISHAEQWMEDNDWEPLGDWESARRLDGSWETRLLVGAL